MKLIPTLVVTCLLLSSPAVRAGWFSSPDPVPAYKEKISSLENQMSAQNHALNLWQIAAGSLGIGCVLLFVTGTALGAQTRQHHHGTTRRLGSIPPAPAGLNGHKKPRVVGKTREADLRTTLAP
jgi:hypothetical protein